MTAGIYCFVGTDTTALFLGIQRMQVLREYLMLMLPLFVTLFFERNLGNMFPRRFAGLLFLVCCNAAIQIIIPVVCVSVLLAGEVAKGKFLAQMSHEIRTPGQSLLSLINDILDFSKIDSENAAGGAACIYRERVL